MRKLSVVARKPSTSHGDNFSPIPPAVRLRIDLTIFTVDSIRFRSSNLHRFDDAKASLADVIATVTNARFPDSGA